MPTSTVPRLSHAEIQSAAARIFVDRDMTITGLASTYPLATLAETLIQIATEIHAALEALPERAFSAQPDDAEGNDVWSAGKVVSHLAEMQLTAIPFWEAIIGDRLDAPDNAILNALDARLLSREESLATAAALEVANRGLVEALLAAGDSSRTATHFKLGTIDGPGALLATCIHLADHLGQLEDMRDTT